MAQATVLATSGRLPVDRTNSHGTNNHGRLRFKHIHSTATGCLPAAVFISRTAKNRAAQPSPAAAA
jgi:hypothetical protein